MTTTTAKKTAPAKPAAKAAPAAPTATVRKLRWQIEDADKRKGKEPWPSSASVDGHDYVISRDGDKKWTATVTHDGTTTVLSDNSFGAAYAACVAHNRAR